LKWAENPKNEVAAFRVLKLLPGIGPSNAHRCFRHLATADFRIDSLRSFRAPVAARPEWNAFCDLLETLGAAELDDPGWHGQLGAVRRWYGPQLERLYDGVETREADIEQLEQISGRYPTRERFLTELTLDPPSAAGDLAGDPLLDEDYLVLSTVHSAKGQEWDAVYVLNVTIANADRALEVSRYAAGSRRRPARLWCTQPLHHGKPARHLRTVLARAS
jgi:DNA helicase-2/ATP-dependent DNA helicase PcrA